MSDRKTRSIVICIATKGRPAVLAETIADLENQAYAPKRVIVGYTSAEDIGDGSIRFPDVEFIHCEAGLTKQRNALLNTLGGEDLVLFLDDDFYLQREYLHFVNECFSDNPAVVAMTGTVLQDGIGGPGLKSTDARAHLAATVLDTQPCTYKPVFNAYGCNMCFRVDIIQRFGLRFDERLPLYGWYEDVDFCRQLAVHGGIVRVSHALGVHLGVKSGRQSGRRLGYSQVANPIYLARKRSVPWSFAAASVTSRLLKNVIFSVSPEDYVDRRGRLRGNLLAMLDLGAGRISPLRILEL